MSAQVCGGIRWVFGDPDSGAYLVKFSWTSIARHAMVKGTASPDDPALAGYWAERRKKVKPPLDNRTLRLLAKQNARCPLCGEHLLTADQLPQTPESLGTVVAAGRSQGDSRQLPCLRATRPEQHRPHPPCARRLLPRTSHPHQQEQSRTTRAHALAACMSRVPRRVARTVLR